MITNNFNDLPHSYFENGIEYVNIDGEILEVPQELDCHNYDIDELDDYLIPDDCNYDTEANYNDIDDFEEMIRNIEIETSKLKESNFNSKVHKIICDLTNKERDAIYFNAKVKYIKEYQKNNGYEEINVAKLKRDFNKKKEKINYENINEFRDSYFTIIQIDKLFKQHLLPNGYFNTKACILGVLNPNELFYIGYKCKLMSNFPYIKDKAQLLLKLLNEDVENFERIYNSKK